MEGLRPFFTFFGGKWRSAPRYPPPAYDTIIEPFAGSAGYSLRYPSCKVFLIDRDEQVAGTWKYLIGAKESEIRALPLVKEGQHVDDFDIPQEARWLIGWWLNKGTTQPAKTPGKWMRESQDGNLYWGQSVKERIAAGLQHIRHWEVRCAHYSFAPEAEATWFIDPPYLTTGNRYYFGRDLIDYKALAEWCKTRQGQVMVCESAGATWLPFGPLTGKEVVWAAPQLASA